MDTLVFLEQFYENKCIKEVCGLTLDFGRQRLSDQELSKLIEFGKSKELLKFHLAMCEGELVNTSEGRSALHTSLRDIRCSAPHYNEVKKVLDKMLSFASSVRSGIWVGSTGKRITDVINIGIGGSDMGPRAVYHALRQPIDDIKLHFLASADGTAFDRITADLDPYSTLVVVSSKSFKTRETIANAFAIDEWFANSGIVGEKRKHHMVVVSANLQAASLLDLPLDNLFPFWNWVGGRFSVWGSVGLPVAIALGPDAFNEFLMGAHEMDMHAETAPLENNVPALLALLSYWNTNHLNVSSHCFLPYDERLRIVVSWLQQLEMESLGKNKTSKGNKLSIHTGMGVWGGHGNESQHSFYQWLREGTSSTSIDICWCENSGHSHEQLHRVLKSNARAQAEALVTREYRDYFNAVTAITIDELTPKRLGALMAMYEHKTTMLGTLFGINPFDQPGVEFGKRLSLQLEQNQ